MFKLFFKRFFYFIDVTSLDVFFGTLGMLAFIDFSLQINTVFYVYPLSIAVVIWLTYFTDHIIDAKFFNQKLLPRHSFFVNNKLAVSCCIFFVFLITLFVIFMLDTKFLIQYGGIALIFVVCRWAFRKLVWIHTITIAMGYSVGVFSPYIYLNKFNSIQLSNVLLFLMVFSFSIANVTTINFIERDDDKREGQRTIFSIHNSRLRFSIIVFCLFSIQVLISFFLWKESGVYLLLATASVFASGYIANFGNKNSIKALIELSLGLPFIFKNLYELFTRI
jgi:4-hydroxybenzoate polyprenyltransferase